MTENTFKDLLIRDACVREIDLGFIIAGDPQKEEEEVPYTHGFRWDRGELFATDSNFDAHTLAIVEKPEYGVMRAAQSGDYSIQTRRGVFSGNIFDQANNPEANFKNGLFRAVCTVDQMAYAVGYRGIVYRFEDFNSWLRIDDGLPPTFDIESIDGFNTNDLYAVGLSGNVWTYGGASWIRREVPTNLHLSCVKCVEDNVYIGGKQGMLLRGRGDDWEIINHQSTESDIWDIEFFKEKIYVSTMGNVYRLEGEQLVAVEFGDEVPSTCYKLDAISECMWSIGAKDILSFDGSNWQRIV